MAPVKLFSHGAALKSRAIESMYCRSRRLWLRLHVVGYLHTPLDPARVISQRTSTVVHHSCEQGLINGTMVADLPFWLPRVVHQTAHF